MKKLFTILVCSAGLSVGALAQGPGAVPPSSPAVASPTASAADVPSPAESADSSTLAGKIHKKINRNLHGKGFHFDIDSDSDSDASPSRHRSDGDIPDNVIPIVGIAVLGVFGLPVLGFAILLYFAFSKNRMMHRTIRMMVEKGQPVPAALLNPPQAVRKRSDMRRGVILIMIGGGLMAFLAAVNDGEGGAWAVGIIPFLIGLGYLLVWKLEGKSDGEAKADNPPPLP